MTTAAATTTESNDSKSPPPKIEEITEAQKRLRNEEEVALYDYLRSLSNDTPIKVTVIRAYPKSWKGHSIAGTLESFEEPIEEETIKDMYGGGTYRLRVMRPSEKGEWRYFTNRTIKIAGDPKIRGLIEEESGVNGSSESPSIVQTTLNQMGSMAQRAEERARRAEEASYNRGPDPIVQSALEASREEAREARRMAMEERRRFEARMEQSQNQRGHTDVLFEKFIDGESARMTALRAQHESEVRSMRDRYEADMSRQADRADDLIRRTESAHEREISNLNRSHEGRIESLTLANKSEVSSLKREISHLERELMAAKTELAEYRAKRDKPVTEQLMEMNAIREAFEGFGGKSEEKEGSVVERVIGNVLNSSLAEGVASRLATGMAPEGMASEGAPQQGMVQQDQEIPINQPVQLPDGRIIVRKADGSVVELKRKKKNVAPTGEELPDLDPGEVKIAVEFMETCFQKDMDPAEFAATARSLVPGSVLTTLRAMGVDHFLSDVAKIPDNSPLMTVAGKNWARKVAQSLLGG